MTRKQEKYERMTRKERQAYVLIAAAMWSTVGLLWLATNDRKEDTPCAPQTVTSVQ